MSTLTITNAVIFDGWDAELVRGSIVVDGGVITAIHSGSADDGSGGDGDGQRLDAGGSVVTPGFIDAHFHAYAHSLDGLEIERGPLSYAALAGARRLEDALRRGFTTVRDVAGGDLGLATAIERGLITAPHYLFSGPALSQTGGHGDPRNPAIDLCFAHGHLNEIVDGVEQVRLAVRQRLRTGAHCIKIMASGGVFSLSDPLRIPQYSTAEIDAAVDEATRRGSYVAAHAYSAEAVSRAVRHGVRTIEHGNLIDAEAAQLIAEHDAFLVPTLATYQAMAEHGEQFGLNATSLAKNDEVLEGGKHAVSLAYQAGAAVGFGTDLMGDLGEYQLDGIRLQVEASSVLDTLRAMTVTNAQIIGDQARGRIEVGARADLIIHPGNPLEQPDVLWDGAADRTVLLGGEPV